jgi:hypothetical protein
LIIIPFTGTVDKAGHSQACTVCLPAVPDAPRQEAAAEPGAQREAVVPDAEEAEGVAVAALDVAAEAARGAQPVAAAEVELGAQQVAAVEAPGALPLAAELGAQPVAELGAQPAAEAESDAQSAAQGEQPRAAAQLQVVAARPALQPSWESAALRVRSMVREAAKISCRRLGLAVLAA